MFILIVVVGRSMVRPAGPVAGNAPAAAPATEAAPGTPPDLSSMTPLEAADRLFNRVMQSASSGDSAQIEAFLPMAVAAYERARPLNLDGLFHLSLLNRTGGALDAALNAADEILQQDPNHLLGLAAAAEASAALGQASVAETHYRRILEIYDTESASGREEYSMHAGILNTLKTEAETFLSTR
jgi:tetratricopeptide (TPR) repeat protein